MPGLRRRWDIGWRKFPPIAAPAALHARHGLLGQASRVWPPWPRVARLRRDDAAAAGPAGVASQGRASVRGAEFPFRRAVVTGGAGFLGARLCKRLLDSGSAVVCVVNLLTS